MSSRDGGSPKASDHTRSSIRLRGAYLTDETTRRRTSKRVSEGEGEGRGRQRGSRCLASDTLAHEELTFESWHSRVLFLIPEVPSAACRIQKRRTKKRESANLIRGRPFPSLLFRNLATHLADQQLVLAHEPRSEWLSTPSQREELGAVDKRGKEEEEGGKEGTGEKTHQLCCSSS